MRILVATTPGWGHVSPVLPLAEELRRRGHQLVWATASDAAESLEAHGFDVARHGLPLRERLPLAARVLAERAPGTPPGELRAHAFTVHFALFGALRTFEGIDRLVETFRPDVVVREPGELASAVAASGAGLPLVTVGFGGIVPAPARRMADEALAEILTTTDVRAASERRHFGDLYLHPMPASMDVETPPSSVRRVRPGSTASSPTADRRTVPGAGSRPFVYATFGTEFGAIAPWGPVLEALGVLDVDALVTTGPPGLPSDVQVPPNVVVERYVDQREVFGRAAAVVSHGGSGTLLGAAMAGVPQVCIPIGADQFENAAAVAARGIGVVVDPDRRHVSAIVDAVQRSTSDPSVASASAEVAAELAAAPDLREAADWIEGLVVTTSNA